MKRLTEEHNMRRLEQKELVQRLDNNENSGKADIQELFSKLKREQVPVMGLCRERGSIRALAPIIPKFVIFLDYCQQFGNF